MHKKDRSIKEVLVGAHRLLKPQVETARLDAEVLLMAVLQKTRGWLYAHPDICLSGTQAKAFRSLVHRRCQGDPVAYLLGHKAFWTFDLTVSQDTLIPRPETELLVEQVLEHQKKDKGSQHVCHVLELGIGSGAIAIALATARPHWSILATDISKPALRIAQSNIKRLGLEHQITCRWGDWFDALVQGDGPFDVVVSNPPYVSTHAPCLHRGDVRFEPKGALLAGQDGLQWLRLLITQSKIYLKPNGWLWLEHGYQQADAVQTLYKQAGYHDPQTYIDLAGHPRVTGAGLSH